MSLRHFTLCLHADGQLDDASGKAIQLRRESAYITEYIMRAMNKTFPFGCGRINLLATEAPTCNNAWLIDSILEMQIPFSYEYFTYTDRNQKEQYLFEAIGNGIRLLCEDRKWDFSEFEKHLTALKESNFHVEFYQCPKQSPDRKTVAKLYCVQTMAEATFYVDFYQKRKLVLRKKFAVTEPYAGYYRYDIYYLRWKDNRTVEVLGYYKDKTAEVSMDGRVDCISDPKQKYKEILPEGFDLNTTHSYEEFLAALNHR
ncbi:MAG: hypothetical protein E7651_01350 [Ruminococcaceae bacterium]|nr:hypothetical protein [Oscillospiraceae bacterium]